MQASDVRDRVVKRLEQLLEVSGELRQALLSREPGRIMEVVSRQDDLLAQAPLLPRVEDPEVLNADPQVSDVAGRLRRLQQANRLLASAFLTIYRNTLQSSALSAVPDPGLYGRCGIRGASPMASVLLQQTG